MTPKSKQRFRWFSSVLVWELDQCQTPLESLKRASGGGASSSGRDSSRDGSGSGGGGSGRGRKWLKARRSLSLFNDCAVA